MKRRSLSCTPQQKARIEGKSCVVCASPYVEPAHLIDRSLAPTAGQDERAVIALCRRDHEMYDAHELDLSPYLEPRYREETAFAVENFGLWKTVRRLTGRDWVEVAPE